MSWPASRRHSRIGSSSKTDSQAPHRERGMSHRDGETHDSRSAEGLITGPEERHQRRAGKLDYLYCERTESRVGRHPGTLPLLALSREKASRTARTGWAYRLRTRLSRRRALKKRCPEPCHDLKRTRWRPALRGYNRAGRKIPQPKVQANCSLSARFRASAGSPYRYFV